MTYICLISDGGDKDERDSLDMRRMERMKRGLEDTSVFEKRIGKFEKHTKVLKGHFIWREQKSKQCLGLYGETFML